MSYILTFARRQDAASRVQARHRAALASQTVLADDSRRGHPEAVVRQLVDHEADQLVHVDVHCLERNGDVAGQALERARMVDGDEFARAIVARYLTLELGMIELGDDHFGLLEARLLLRRLYDYVALYLLVVGYELPEVLAATQRDHLGRHGLQPLDQRGHAEEFGLFEHVERHVLGRQVIAANEI